MIPTGRVCIVKTEDQELNFMVHQITKFERQIIYHEQSLSDDDWCVMVNQALCGSGVRDRIENIQVLYLTDQTCLLT